MPAAEQPDPAFFDRADAHIHLANKHAEDVEPGKASASFLYASSRYQAFVIAMGSESASDMKAQRGEAIDYFVEQFRRMLEDNVDDFIDNFDSNTRGDDA